MNSRTILFGMNFGVFLSNFAGGTKALMVIAFMKQQIGLSL